MAMRVHYKFSQETLSYVKVQRSVFHRFFGNHPLLAVGVVLVLFFGMSFLVPSRAERTLARRNSVLRNELNQLEDRAESFERAIVKLTQKDDSLYRAILGTDPLSNPIRIAGLGGSSMSRWGKGDYSQDVQDVAERLEILNAQVKVQDQSYKQLFALAAQKSKRLEFLPAIMPISNHDLSKTGSGFGMRFHPILKIWRMHEGIDFYARVGTPVYATADGKVKEQHYSTTFGKLIVLDHGGGLSTYYAHLSAFDVKEGQKVMRGQIIGRVGTTGLSAGPHLHYEVHRNGDEVDPVNYFFNDLSAEQYESIVEMASREMNSMD